MRHRHGAVVVKGGRVLSIGINKHRNDPENIQKSIVKASCSVHAEVDALSRISNAKGATIYVARVAKNGETALSRPCNNCWTAIQNSGIRKVVFT
jgi:deoxycytidylate deaminase